VTPELSPSPGKYKPSVVTPRETFVTDELDVIRDVLAVNTDPIVLATQPHSTIVGAAHARTAVGFGDARARSEATKVVDSFSATGPGGVSIGIHTVKLQVWSHISTLPLSLMYISGWRYSRHPDASASFEP
jgi:hypothetical protein